MGIIISNDLQNTSILVLSVFLVFGDIVGGTKQGQMSRRGPDRSHDNRR